jgi:hypothetical protein
MSDPAPFGPEHYVPALRWKAGEIRAFKKLLAWKQADGVTPVFVIDNPLERQQNERGSRVPTEPIQYIDYVASEMQKVLGDHRAFVDTVLFDRMRTGVDGLSRFFETMFSQLANLVPVLRLEDTRTRLDALKATVAKTGAALRLPPRQGAETETIAAFLRDLGCDETNVDVILDLGHLRERIEAKPTADVLTALANRANRWRTITLLAGSYPATLEPTATSPAVCTRFDREAYEAVRTELGNRNVRLPSYGDYGIVYADAEPTSGTLAGGGARPIIRYCTSDAWLVWKSAEGAEAGKTSPYFALARACATHPLFMGGDFSYGDEYIDDRATGQPLGGGQSVVYITVDMNHHLAFAAAQHNGTPPAPRPRPWYEVSEPNFDDAEPEDDADDLDDDSYWDL